MENNFENTAEVPLIERLRRVSIDGREWVKDAQGSTNVPYGRLLHKAADRLEKIERCMEVKQNALRALIELGRKDTSNEKYDRYWTNALEALCDNP